jgi:Fe2+ or Zn2+ uptake regulation protein
MLQPASEGEDADRQRVRTYAELMANITPCHECGGFFYEDFSDLIESAIHDARKKLGRDLKFEELSFEATCGECSSP